MMVGIVDADLLASGTRTHGIDMARQMPFYGLYDAFVAHRLAMGDKPAGMVM